MPEIRADTAMPGQLSRMFDIQHRPLSHTRRTTAKIARAAALIRALLYWLERQRDRDDDADTRRPSLALARHCRNDPDTASA